MNSPGQGLSGGKHDLPGTSSLLLHGLRSVGDCSIRYGHTLGMPEMGDKNPVRSQDLKAWHGLSIASERFRRPIRSSRSEAGQVILWSHGDANVEARYPGSQS
jgi:hypothetical protein